MSDIQIPGVESIFLDELSARFHLVPHQDGEDLVSLDSIFNIHPQEGPAFRIHRSFPKLQGIHLTQPFIPLDGKVLPARRKDVIQQDIFATDGSLLLSFLNHQFIVGEFQDLPVKLQEL